MVAGCGGEQDTRPEPVAEPSREPIVRDAEEAADWISEALTYADGWEWVPAKDDPDDEIDLSLQRGDEVIWPVRRVMKRYRNGSEDGIAAYVASILAG